MREPTICGGQPTFRGTRVLLRAVLGQLAGGADQAEVLSSYPSLTPEHLRAAIVFAATSAVEDLPAPPPPPKIQAA